MRHDRHTILPFRPPWLKVLSVGSSMPATLMVGDSRTFRLAL